MVRSPAGHLYEDLSSLAAAPSDDGEEVEVANE